jgi:hypothetical protein
MKSLAVCSLLALLAAPSLALEPYLVHDINPLPEPADFPNVDHSHGVELWAVGAD